MTHIKQNGAIIKVAMKTHSSAFTAISAGLTYAKRVGGKYLFVYSAKKSTINGAYSKPNLSSLDKNSKIQTFGWNSSMTCLLFPIQPRKL
jgi:hypothetical protein